MEGTWKWRVVGGGQESVKVVGVVGREVRAERREGGGEREKEREIRRGFWERVWGEPTATVKILF